MAASALGRHRDDQTPLVRKPSIFFGDPTVNYEALRALNYAPTGGADILEVLQTLDTIDPANTDTWYDAFHNLATMVEGWGDESAAKKRGVSARQAYARASMYHRSSGFWLTSTPNDPRQMASYDASVACFHKAIQGSTPKVEPVEIPYAGTTLPGYLCRGEGKGNQPLLIAHTGFDGTAEEIFFAVRGAIERGYALLIFDGPGQGGALRKRGLTFIPDWEKPVGAVIDFAERQKGLDLRHLALAGFSFGGYLAPRAAAFDERIKICIADGGVYSMFDNVLNQLPPVMKELLTSDPAKFSQYYQEYTTQDLAARWSLGNGMYTFGAKDAASWLNDLRAYQLMDVAPKIKANTLVIDSEGDTLIGGQAKPLYDALTGPKTYMVFTTKEAAQLHCQVGAELRMSQRIFDWLDEATGR